MKRSNTQNASLHLFFRLLAEELNDAGLDQRTVLKESVQIPWTETAIKEQIWRPIQQAVTGKASSTDLSRAEVGDIYEVLNRHLGSKFGVFVEWPNAEKRAADCDFYDQDPYM